MALGLSSLRQRSLGFYALVEIAFGLSALWESSENIAANPGNWTLVGASAYLLARGFNNFRDSLKQDRD